MILDDIVRHTLEKMGDVRLELIDIGITYPYTYSIVRGKHGVSVGLCMTMVTEIGDYEHKTPIDANKYLEISDLVKGALDRHLLKRFLGIATINAVSQYLLRISGENYNLDVTDIISKNYSEANKYNVAVIGYMKPVVQRLREKGYKVYVFERNPILREDAYPDFFEYRYLPVMDIVIATGAALINDTIDQIVERSKKARDIILTGPTAQVHPKFIERKGISYLSSIYMFFKRNEYRIVRDNIALGNEKILWSKGVKYSIKIEK